VGDVIVTIPGFGTWVNNFARGFFVKSRFWPLLLATLGLLMLLLWFVTLAYSRGAEVLFWTSNLCCDAKPYFLIASFNY
jgi:hypothetical protein